MAEYITKTFRFEGKRYYVRGKTEEEAIANRAIKLKELEEGKRTIDGNTRVQDWAEEWLETYKQPTVNARHYKDLRNIVNNFIVPAIGPMKVKMVKPVHLQKILNGLPGYSNSYIKKIYDVIRQIFSEAYKNALTPINPAESLRKPTGRAQNKRRAITDKERELTLKVAEYHRGGLFVLIMLYCGLRPGEVAALRWTDIDLTRGIMYVSNAVKADNRIDAPKTDAGVRQVPIPRPLAERLSEREHTPFELVCTNTRGGRYTASSFQAMWENFKREMNIEAGCRVFRNQLVPPYPIAEDLTLYCYRHTYGTDLQAAGVPINVAKELMGHSSIAVTAQIYTHKSDAAFNNAAELINNYAQGSVAQVVAQEAETIEIKAFNA